MKQSEWRHAQARAAEVLAACGIVLTDEERDKLEVADFGLGELDVQGLELIT